MYFVPRHLDAFKASLNDSFDAWVGVSPKSWGQHLEFELHQVDQLAGHSVSRDYLFELASNPKINDQTFAISVLAWGGMNRGHGKSLFSVASNWLPIVGQLRSEQISSSEAYARFLRLRLDPDRHLPGMGPAYFTKLIFFAAPKHDGYIMDQWTARSANLLTGEALVRTTVTTSKTGRIQHTVSDRNDAEIYGKFCDFVRALAKEVDHEGQEGKIEEAIFSKGRGKGTWRNYVIEHG